MEMEIEIRVDY